MSNLWGQTIDSILSFVFRDNYETIYDFISIKPNGLSFKIAMRYNVLDSKWTTYDLYFKPTTGVIDDIIRMYNNSSISISNVKYQAYTYGDTRQRIEIIKEFDSDTANIDVIPMNVSIVSERSIGSLGRIYKYPNKYRHIYRQSYNIEVPDKSLTSRTKTYLKNWLVTKTVSIYDDREVDYSKIISNIQAPKLYDELEIEFDYCGDIYDFQNSLISLIEFVYLMNPSTRCLYKFVSYDYIFYSHRCNNLLPTFMRETKVDQINGYRHESLIPEHSHHGLFIYNNDNNYIVVDRENIDFNRFSDFGDFNFAVVNCYYNEEEVISTDIYFSNEAIHLLPYDSRFEYLSKLVSMSKLFELDSCDDEVIKIYQFDDFNRINVLPNEFRVKLRLKLNLDESSYMLYSSTEALSTPLLLDNMYRPNSLRNQFERDIAMNRVNVNGDVVEFRCILTHGWIELEPIKVVDHEPDSIKDVLIIILSAYEHLQILTNDKTESKDIEYLYQFLIEKYNHHQEFKNVLVYMPHDEYMSSTIVNFVDLFIHFNRLIYKSSVESVVNNLYKHYNRTTISPIIGDTKIVKSSNRTMNMINMNQEITSIYNVYHNDMNFIITDFFEYSKLNDFVNMIELIKKQASFDGIVLFNYKINHDKNGLLKFIFDIDETINKTDDFDHNKSQYINVERFNKEDSLILGKRAKKARTLVRTRSTLERSNAKIKHQVMKIDNENVYLYEPNPKDTSRIYNYVRDYGINSYNQLIKENDFLLPILKKLSRQMCFDMKVCYPFDDVKFQEKFNFDRHISCEFTRDNDFYSDFVSIEMRI